MKNANIFIDVDLTLVDGKGRLLPGAREALVRLKDTGCHLFLWSSVGADYCRRVAALHHLNEVFEGFTAKPDIIVDDMPSTCIEPIVYDVQKEESWATLTVTIIERHVDRPVAGT
jgi:hypothetical protein